MSYSQSAGAMISTPYDIVKWLNALFTGKIINSASLESMTRLISENNQPVDMNNLPESSTSELFTELGIGSGIGLGYFKNNGITWAHAGGMPGYESFFAYSPCNGIYLALAYNVKPKQQLIFI